MMQEVKQMLRQGHLILVVPYLTKLELLKELQTESQFHTIKFLTKEEILEQLTYTIRDQSILEVMKEKQVIPSVAQLLLQNMRNVTKYPVSNSKVEELHILEKHLKEIGCLQEHSLFFHFLKHHQVVFYGYSELELLPVLERLRYHQIPYQLIAEKVSFKKEIPVLEYGTIEEEIVSVAEMIVHLIHSGVSCDHIYLHCLSDEYVKTVKRVFAMFHIPLQLQEKNVLYQYEITQTFLDLCKQSQDSAFIIEQLQAQYPQTVPFYQEMITVFVSLLNTYAFLEYDWDSIYQVLVYELQHRKVREKKYENVVREVDVTTRKFTEEEHVFVLGANYGTFPMIHKNDCYFSDLELEALHLLTSQQRNECEKRKVEQLVNEIVHLHISYKLKTPFSEFLPPAMVEDMENVLVIKETYHYSNDSYNQILLAQYLDDYTKYNTKHPWLDVLSQRYMIPYATYQNTFTGIDPHALYDYLQHFCLLSYTTMDMFFKCKFRFFLYSILKLRPPFVESSSLIVGNLFHSILEKVLQDFEHQEQIIQEEIKKFEKPVMSAKERFYFQKWEREIRKLLVIIEEQQKRSTFHNTYFEKNFALTVEKEITFCLTGKIDKILTYEEACETDVVVVDYKTGSFSNSLNRVIYGMNMQLLLYLYFIFHTDTIKNPKFTGAYLHPIVKDVPAKEEGKTFEQLILESNQWDGISVNLVERLRKLDTKLEDGSFIKGIRLKQDGGFYASNKILSEELLEQLLSIVRNHIDTVMDQVCEANFEIDPKRFLSDNGEISSCAFCPYRDICYRSPKDVKTLKEYKNLEFLKEES